MSAGSGKAPWIGLIPGVDIELASCDGLGDDVSPVGGFTCTPVGCAPLLVSFDAGARLDSDGESARSVVSETERC